MLNETAKIQLMPIVIADNKGFSYEVLTETKGKTIQLNAASLNIIDRKGFSYDPPKRKSTN